jgi:hypothetical protein
MRAPLTRPRQRARGASGLDSCGRRYCILQGLWRGELSCFHGCSDRRGAGICPGTRCGYSAGEERERRGYARRRDGVAQKDGLILSRFRCASPEKRIPCRPLKRYISSYFKNMRSFVILESSFRHRWAAASMGNAKDNCETY